MCVIRVMSQFVSVLMFLKKDLQVVSLLSVLVCYQCYFMCFINAGFVNKY